MGKTLSFEEALKFSDKGSRWLRITEEEPISGVFRGDFYSYRQHWTPKGGVICAENAGCFRCDSNPPIPRFALNFLIKNGDGFEPKILEVPQKAFKAILQQLNQHGFDAIYRIERLGSGANTAYSVTHASDLSEEEKAGIEACELHKLEEIYKKMRR